MSDIYTKAKRSEIMSSISGKETKPEIMVRKFLFNQGFRYRKNVPSLPGKPDVVIPKYKASIFVNGCFWHGHNCKAAALPKTRRSFWEEKIGSNIKRDQRNHEDLRNLGWQVLVVWECELKNKEAKEDRLNRLVDEIKN